MTPNLQKCKIQQTIRTVSPISKVMTSTSTPPLSQHSFFGSAMSHAWVYNLMYIPLLTVLPSKREMQTLLDMSWLV